MPLSDGAMQAFALTLDTFLDHAAKWHPDAEVITAGEMAGDGAGGAVGSPVRRITYRALRDDALRISAALARTGVAVGDRVATLAWNTQDHMAAWYAIMGMGAVCHTLNPRLTAEQLGWMLAQSQARVLFAGADLVPLARRIVAEAGTAGCRIVAIDGESDDAEASLRTLTAGIEPDFAWGGFAETAPCGLCFTSGTTGAPKGVTYTHRGNYLHTLRLLQADVIGLTARDTVLPVVPMFHANAWGLPFACPAVGAKLVLPGRHADGASLARLIAAQGVTVAVGVPTVWLGLFDHLDAAGQDLPTLARIMVGGAPMSAALMQRIEARGIEVQTTWGMTELSPLGTATPPGSVSRDLARDPARDPTASGRPAPGVDLRLADAAGEPLAQQRGAEGHLWVRGASVVERYFGQEASATRDGWFDTGDLAALGHDGTLRITGRAKDLIKSGGEWINPAEIEAIVSALPAVAQAAVIGRADPKWGERPLLLVELREHAEASDADLTGALEGRVASWWIPREIVRLSQMPLAATGKIDKSRLRADYCPT